MNLHSALSCENSLKFFSKFLVLYLECWQTSSGSLGLLNSTKKCNLVEGGSVAQVCKPRWVFITLASTLALSWLPWFPFHSLLPLYMFLWVWTSYSSKIYINMLSMDPCTFWRLTLEAVTAKFGSEKVMNEKRCLRQRRASMNGWTCHLASPMAQALSWDWWTKCSSLSLTNLWWSTSMIF